MEELKRCPFCGGKAHVMKKQNRHGVEFYIVQCTRCRASSGGVNDEQFAIDAWNERTGGEESA